ncbi:MAG TPA: hypothetical protein VF885_26675 [Arthrobacter sp.]
MSADATSAATDATTTDVTDATATGTAETGAPAAGDAGTQPVVDATAAATDATTDAAATESETGENAEEQKELSAEELLEQNRKKNSENKSLRTTNKSLTTQIEELTAQLAAQPTEEQRSEATAALEATNATLTTDNLRLTIAAAAVLPKEYADHLKVIAEHMKGGTEEELKSSAEALLAVFPGKQAASTSPTRTVNPGQQVAHGHTDTREGLAAQVFRSTDRL